jgi:hypothetical protein
VVVLSAGDAKSAEFFLGKINIADHLSG